MADENGCELRARIVRHLQEADALETPQESSTQLLRECIPTIDALGEQLAQLQHQKER